MDGCLTTDSYLFDSGLNEFFTNVGKNLASNFNTAVNANDMLNCLSEPSSFNICFEPVNEDVIQTVVISLKNSSPGYKEMPTAVYKGFFI